MRAAILIIAVAAAVSPRPVDAQVRLSTADSVEVLLATFAAAASDADFLSEPLIKPDQVIWWIAEGSWLPSEAILDRIRTEFPNLRTAPTLQEVVICEDGGRPRYPSRPCPIRDDGVALRFGEFVVPSPDHDLNVSFSHASRHGLCGLAADFVRGEEGLELRRFWQPWIS